MVFGLLTKVCDTVDRKFKSNGIGIAVSLKKDIVKEDLPME